MRLERVLAFLERHAPDVLCLQELKCIDDKFPVEAIRTAGYHAAFYGQKTYNGVAILSKKEPTKVVKGFGDGVDDPAARFICAEIDGVNVISGYIPNGQEVGSPAFKYKLEWLGRLRRYLETHFQPSEKLVLVGDFNVAPEDRDVHDPDAWRGQVLFSEPEKAALENLVNFGLVDTYRIFHSEGGRYSWWDYRELGFPLNKGLRIDFIFATPPLSKRCKSSEIDRDERKGTKPSDHAPVISEFDI